ncbi:2-dehydro-3-deoxygalactonokinase [Aliiroseovarius sediminis]|uniref:2-dehydro-3-deoxygalactonokinase n=1 Tax=Aliiroseovarius sediminis TaxID=2925839 RepID=UPI001F563C13|nr:2-dehydro-3-deoxygalactonokinase [Aliiroseovarius sediminis]MCI2395145.1 2-dehydro-3-deoxygalactonokinase [Aliiroseovarius sediminis]
MPNPHPAWIAVNCTPHRLHVWLMDTACATLEKRVGEHCGRPVATLHNMLADVLCDTPLFTMACGLSNAGAPPHFVPVPSAPPGRAAATRVTAGGLDLHLLPGLHQTAPTDVMYGDETLIAGFLAAEADFDGILCLPGNHTRWAHISAGEVVSFRSFMTGELFGLITGKSLLRETVAGGGWDQSAFNTALADTMSRPTDLAAKFMSLYAEGMQDTLPPATARARLSAALVGAELGAAKPYWLGQQVVILGQTDLGAAYHAALAAQGVAVRIVDATDLPLAGLIAAYLDD